jgi:hypothetical protein
MSRWHLDRRRLPGIPKIGARELERLQESLNDGRGGYPRDCLNVLAREGPPPLPVGGQRRFAPG